MTGWCSTSVFNLKYFKNPSFSFFRFVDNLISITCRKLAKISGGCPLRVRVKFCPIFLKFKNNPFCMVKHQYWSTNTWEIKTNSEKRQFKNIHKWKFTIFKVYLFSDLEFISQVFVDSFFGPRVYISGICGPILMFDMQNRIFLFYFIF